MIFIRYKLKRKNLKKVKDEKREHYYTRETLEFFREPLVIKLRKRERRKLENE